METVQLKEKLALAKELKLKHQISNLEYKDGMFDLKFHRISRSEILKRLTFSKWQFNRTPVICAILMIVLGCLMLKQIDNLPMYFMAFHIIPIVGLLLVQSRRTTRVFDCWVDDFRWEIPYGAMLALKEAGKKGIIQHRVHYPVWNNPFERFKESLLTMSDDPIITGITPNGEMVEIYAWNENDVYDV